MRTRSLLAALPLAVLTLSGTSVANADPTPPPATGIVGGVPATEVYSFMASLQYEGGYHACGASLIAPSWLVTAEHCTEANPSQARIGTTTYNSGGEIRQILSHRVLGGDVALLQLATPSTMSPVEIAESAPIGSSTRIIGWGQTCPIRGCGGTPVGLRQLDTSILSESSCGIDSDELCIEGGGGRGACWGDSGGPAVTGGPGAWKLVGATSRGTASTCAVTPSIYGNVTAYRSQILQIIGGGAAATR